jgi:ABC-type proline/glycine betaine transport system permease subunit
MNFDEIKFFVVDAIKSIFRPVSRVAKTPLKRYLNRLNCPNAWITLLFFSAFFDYFLVGTFQVHFFTAIGLVHIYKYYMRGDWKHRYRLQLYKRVKPHTRKDVTTKA